VRSCKPDLEGLDGMEMGWLGRDVGLAADSSLGGGCCTVRVFLV
jgi:hypothetical protein